LKTSESDPIQIAELKVPGVKGLIGITFCPGKKDPSAGWDRDLELDLDAIERWDAAAVITLLARDEFGEIEVPDEFKLLGVTELPAALERRRIPWFHLPIVDVSVPDREFEEKWQRVGPEIHKLLADGKRVLVHCRGGLGRAGTVAACLLVESGVDPEAAIAEVRRVRPGAIETREQERYVRNHRRAGSDP
jgi:ADP-ribosyl-[dinitrogen reductase] hydrolase